MCKKVNIELPSGFGGPPGGRGGFGGPNGDFRGGFRGNFRGGPPGFRGGFGGKPYDLSARCELLCPSDVTVSSLGADRSTEYVF